MRKDGTKQSGVSYIYKLRYLFVLPNGMLDK